MPAAALLLPQPARAEAPQLKAQVPGYYRLMVGKAEVTALFDGAIELDSKLLKNTTPAEVQRLLGRVVENIKASDYSPEQVDVVLITHLHGDHMGGLVHNAAVQFAKPDVTIEFDLDQQQAASSRRKLYKQTAAGKSLVAGAHLPFPGLGHVRAEGKDGKGGYAWVPVEFGPVK